MGGTFTNVILLNTMGSLLVKAEKLERFDFFGSVLDMNHLFLSLRLHR